MASTAQFAIDIAARMTGAEYTNAQLDELTATLSGAGRGASHFSEAIAQVSGDLQSARTAAESANGALAAATDEYKLLERAALQASKAAERAALKNGGVVPVDLQARVDAASAALADQAGTLRGLESAAKAANDREVQLTGTLGNVRKLAAYTDKSLAENAERFSAVRGAVGALGGPLGTLGNQVMGPVQGFQMLTKSIGTSRAAMIAGAAGVAALVVAAVALTAAAIAATIAVAKWAVSLADTARGAALAREAFAAANPELAALSGTFDELNASTGIADDRLRSLQKSLKDARVSAAEMPAALTAAALAERALGQGGSQDFIDRIKAGKLAVSDFANEAQAKFGGIVARQMLGLEAQSQRLKFNLSQTFGGLNIDPALEGLSILVGLFDKNSAAGRAMKLIFETVFQPIIDKAKIAAQVVEAFALGFLIGLTKMYIFLKPVFKSVGDLFGFGDMSLANVCAAVTTAAKYLAPVIAVVAAGFAVFVAAVTATIAAIGIAIGVAMAMTAAIVAVPIAINSAIAAGLAWVATLVNWRAGFEAVIGWLSNMGAALVGAVTSATNSVMAYFASIDWAGLGANIIAGLVAGITNSAGAVVNAIGGAVQGAINKAKSLLGIASPSKVFASIGEYTSEGFAQGVDDGSGAAQSAMATMVEPPVSAMSAFDALSGNIGMPAPAAIATQAAPASAGGASINLSGAQIVFNGVPDAPTGIQQFAEMLTQLLEGDASQLGATT